jgi:hypothetical protein
MGKFGRIPTMRGGGQGGIGRKVRLTNVKQDNHVDQNPELSAKYAADALENGKNQLFMNNLRAEDRELYNTTFSKYGAKGRALFQIFKSNLPYGKEEIKEILADPKSIDHIDLINKLKETGLFTINQMRAVVDDPSRINHIDALIKGAQGLKRDIDNGQTDYAANGNFARMLDYEIYHPNENALQKLGFANDVGPKWDAATMGLPSLHAASRAPDDNRNSILREVGYQNVDHSINFVDALKGIGNLYKEALWDSDFAQGFRFGFGNVASLGSSLLEFIPGVGEAAAGLGVLGDFIKPSGGPWDEIQGKIDSVGKYIPSISNIVDRSLDLALPQEQQQQQQQQEAEDTEEGGRISMNIRRQRKKSFKVPLTGTKRMKWIRQTQPLH